MDASAIGAVLFNEPAADWVEVQLEGALLAAPRLIEYELGNVCWKKCRRHAQAAEGLRKALLALPLLDLQLHDVDAAGALKLAEVHGITFYDASYLWLAQRLVAPLVTLDARLQALSVSAAAR